jgi:hypothetical protein
MTSSPAPAPPSKRAPLAGFGIGILTIDTCHELVPGNVQNASSFGFPVIYEIVHGVSLSALMRGDATVSSKIVEHALALQALGVSAVVGACGSFANYQLEVAKALRVPVFLSILLEVPLLLQVLPASGRLGIIFADAQAFTPRVCDNCGITSTERIVAVGMSRTPAFEPILAQRGALDDEGLRSAVVNLARSTLRAHPSIRAWLLQCSDLPPYANAIRKATALPVFDMVGLIARIHRAIDKASSSLNGRRPASAA